MNENKRLERSEAAKKELSGGEFFSPIYHNDDK